MRNLFAKLWADDAGVVTIEYLVLGTFLALALIVGVATLARGINVELNELTQAILSFNQSFAVSGTSTCVANVTGSQGIDFLQGGPASMQTQSTDPTTNFINDFFCD
jgi:Flp pilus assembly pilin Flp